jgi:prepilin-type N-terminal cleavage/methylation domain-containing protein
MTKSFSKKNSDDKKGFTLLETLVAILLLSVSIAAAATIAQKALQAAEYSRDETVAYYLAAEGLELTQNIRDNNFFAYPQGQWLTGLAPGLDQGNSDPCNANYGNACDIDAVDENIMPCISTGNVCPLYIDTNGQYSHDSSSGSPTAFSRSVTIKPISVNGSPDEAEVTAVVVWKTGSFSTRTIKLQEMIFDWY